MHIYFYYINDLFIIIIIYKIFSKVRPLFSNQIEENKKYMYWLKKMLYLFIYLFHFALKTRLRHLTFIQFFNKCIRFYYGRHFLTRYMDEKPISMN